MISKIVKTLIGFLFLFFTIGLFKTFNDPGRWRNFDSRAEVLVRQGDYQKAYILQREAVKSSKKMISNKQNTDYASALFRLGDICVLLGKFDEAEESFMAADKIFRAVLGEHYQGVVSFHDWMGDIRFGQKRFQEAEDYYKKSISLGRELFGVCEGTYVAWSHLGQLYLWLKKYNAAKEAYLFAINCMEKDGGASLRGAYVYTYLGEVCYHLKEYMAAESYLNTAKKLYLADLKYDFARMIRTFQTLAMTQFAQKNYEKSKRTFKEKLKIIQSNQGHYFWETALTYCGLARLEKVAGNGKKALDYCDQAIENYRQVKVVTMADDREGFLATCGEIYRWAGSKTGEMAVLELVDQLETATIRKLDKQEDQL